MATKKTLLVSAKPAGWQDSFRVPIPPSAREAIHGKNLLEGLLEFDKAHTQWAQTLERSIKERLRTEQTTATAATTAAPAATATTPVQVTQVTNPPVDLSSINSRLTALETAVTKIGVTGRVIVLCSAFTPSAIGADTGEIVVPDNPKGEDWLIDSITLRVQTPGGAPSVQIEQSSVAGAFTPTTIGTVTLSSGTYEAKVTGGLGTITPGDKVRFNVLVLDTAQNWTIEVQLQAP